MVRGAAPFDGSRRPSTESRTMRLGVLAWLAVVLSLFALRAEALTPEHAARIASGDSDDRIAALNEAVTAADAGLVPFLQAVLADEVKVANGKAYVVRDGK